MSSFRGGFPRRDPSPSTIRLMSSRSTSLLFLKQRMSRLSLHSTFSRSAALMVNLGSYPESQRDRTFPTYFLGILEQYAMMPALMKRSRSLLKKPVLESLMTFMVNSSSWAIQYIQMSRQSQMIKQRQDYFAGVRSRILPRSNQLSWRIEAKLEECIADGRIEISERVGNVGGMGGNVEDPEKIRQHISQIEQEISFKSEELRNQMKKLDSRMRRNSQAVPNRRYSSRLLTQQSEASEAISRIQSIKKQHQALRQQSLQKQQQKERQEKSIAAFEQQQSQQQALLQRETKKAMIRQRLNTLENARKKRLEILSAKSVPILPKYKLIERQELIGRAKEQVQWKLCLKQNRINKRKLFGVESIRIHEKEYLEKLKEKYSRRLKSLKSQEMSQVSHSQIFLPNKNHENSESLKQLKARQLEFQEKRRKMKVNVDPSISRSLAINKDKALHPMKYHFLHVKKLTDEEIFSQFKEFALDVDRKRLGNQHLLESKKYIKTEEARQHSKVEASQLQQRPKRPKYENYLHSPQSGNKNVEIELATALAASENKSKVIEILMDQSASYDKSVLRKIGKLKGQTSYEQTAQLEAEIDQEFLKAIKAKMACVGLM